MVVVVVVVLVLVVVLDVAFFPLRVLLLLFLLL